MKEGGIGGFEVATVYPLAVDDPASGFRNYPYLSAEFLDRIAFTSRRARELGLRMDLTIGSGWSYGGPYITPALAASRLRSERREITPGVTSIARPDPFEHDRLVAAFVGLGSVQEADPATYRPLDIPERGPIPLPPGQGPRVVLLYFAGQTGQTVKRAAAGAEGYVLDHYNRAALETHLREAGDKLLAAAEPGSIDSVFCDSLEVYEADWTADLLQEFQRRRGYDLRPLLPIAELGNGERADAVRRDYGRTLTELFEDRFLVPMREWAREEQTCASGFRTTACRRRRLVQLPLRRRLRRRRLRVAHALRDALGLVRVASVRQAGDLVRDLDLAALARVPRDADRSQGGGRSALPLRHQSADRPRLAVLAAAGRLARLDALRRRRLQRQESVVAGHGRHRALSAARELPPAPGRSGRRRGALCADRRCVVAHQAGVAAAI